MECSTRWRCHALPTCIEFFSNTKNGQGAAIKQSASKAPKNCETHKNHQLPTCYALGWRLIRVDVQLTHYNPVEVQCKANQFFNQFLLFWPSKRGSHTQTLQTDTRRLTRRLDQAATHRTSERGQTDSAAGRVGRPSLVRAIWRWRGQLRAADAVVADGPIRWSRCRVVSNRLEMTTLVGPNVFSLILIELKFMTGGFWLNFEALSRFIR